VKAQENGRGDVLVEEKCAARGQMEQKPFHANEIDAYVQAVGGETRIFRYTYK